MLTKHLCSNRNICTKHKPCYKPLKLKRKGCESSRFGSVHLQRKKMEGGREEGEKKGGRKGRREGGRGERDPRLLKPWKPGEISKVMKNPGYNKVLV